jgi:hypothetical protein
MSIPFSEMPALLQRVFTVSHSYLKEPQSISGCIEIGAQLNGFLVSIASLPISTRPLIVKPQKIRRRITFVAQAMGISSILPTRSKGRSL